MTLTQSMLTMPHGRISVCETGGTGLPLLMLHGSGANKEVFSNQFESPLADLHRLIAFDLPGHGASDDADDPEAAYSVAALAQLSGQVLQELGVKRAAVFGWSLGGHVAIQMMGSHPDLLAGVMIMGAPPFGKGPIGMLRAFQLSRDMLLASKETFTEKDAERFERLCYGSEANGAYLPAINRADGRLRAVFNRSLMSREAADQRRIVEASNIPLAVANGSDEAIVRLNYLAQGIDYANLWDGKVHVLPNAGHAAFLQAPNAFNALLHRFVTFCAVREHQAPTREAIEGIARSA